MFGPVFMVTVCFRNGELLRLFKQKRNLESEVRMSGLEGADILCERSGDAIFLKTLAEESSGGERSLLVKYLQYVGKYTCLHDLLDDLLI